MFSCQEAQGSFHRSFVVFLDLVVDNVTERREYQDTPLAGHAPLFDSFANSALTVLRATARACPAGLSFASEASVALTGAPRLPYRMHETGITDTSVACDQWKVVAAGGGDEDAIEWITLWQGKLHGKRGNISVHWQREKAQREVPHKDAERFVDLYTAL